MRKLSLSYSLQETSDSSAKRVLHLDVNLQLTREPPSLRPLAGLWRCSQADSRSQGGPGKAARLRGELPFPMGHSWRLSS